MYANYTGSVCLGGWGLTRFAYMRTEEHISLTGNHAKDFKGTQVKASVGNLQIFKEKIILLEIEGGRCSAVRQMFCGHRRQNLCKIVTKNYLFWPQAEFA